MTKEQIDKIKRRNSLPVADNWHPMFQAKEDIRDLLNALEAEEVRSEYLNTAAHSSQEAYEKMVNGKCGVYVGNKECDRDRWKARAKALERALIKNGCACGTCANKLYTDDGRIECFYLYECICSGEDGLLYNYWKFDELRFMGGGANAKP